MTETYTTGMYHDTAPHTEEIEGAMTPKVLIVDDEEPIVLALCLVVEDLGFEAICASDGRLALELARRADVAIIITDLMMPRMNGDQFLRTLRSEREVEQRSMPRVIVMTAANIDPADAPPADAFMPKPFDIDTVERLIQRLLGDQGVGPHTPMPGR